MTALCEEHHKREHSLRTWPCVFLKQEYKHLKYDNNHWKYLIGCYLMKNRLHVLDRAMDVYMKLL